MSMDQNTTPWLLRDTTVRWLKRGAVAVLLALLVVEAFTEHHGYFGLDGSFGFYAWFGFLSCVVMVVVAKVVGRFLTRPDSYYDGDKPS